MMARRATHSAGLVGTVIAHLLAGDIITRSPATKCINVVALASSAARATPAIEMRCSVFARRFFDMLALLGAALISRLSTPLASIARDERILA